MKSLSLCACAPSFSRENEGGGEAISRSSFCRPDNIAQERALCFVSFCGRAGDVLSNGILCILRGLEGEGRDNGRSRMLLVFHNAGGFFPTVTRRWKKSGLLRTV